MVFQKSPVEVVIGDYQGKSEKLLVESKCERGCCKNTDSGLKRLLRMLLTAYLGGFLRF